jgi:hypothetical protein
MLRFSKPVHSSFWAFWALVRTEEGTVNPDGQTNTYGGSTMTRSEDVETQADDLIGELEKMRNFNPSEKILLRQMREAIRDFLELREILKVEGLIAEGSQGQPVAHPGQAMKVAAADRISRWLRQLSLLEEAPDALDALDDEKKQILGL